MVKFGKQLLYHQVDGWNASYINYKDLKKIAKIGVYDARDGSTIFLEEVKKEVDKVEQFYIERLRDFEEQYKLIRGWKAPTGDARPRAPTTPGRLRVLSGGGAGGSSEEDEENAEPSKMSQRASLERAVVDLWRHVQYLTNFCILNYTGFVKITKKYKKLHKAQQNDDTHTRCMAYVHQSNFVKHEALLRLDQATQSLMARRFYGGNLTLANAALRLKQNPPSDWHQFRQGMHLGVFLMLLVWTIWASRLLTFDSKPHLGGQNLVKRWSHPASPVYRLVFSLILVEWCWAVCLFIWNRYRVNYVFMMGLRPHGKEHYQEAFESAINVSIIMMFNYLLFIKLAEAEIPSNRWFSEGVLPVCFLCVVFISLSLSLSLSLPFSLNA